MDKLLLRHLNILFSGDDQEIIEGVVPLYFFVYGAAHALFGDCVAAYDNITVTPDNDILSDVQVIALAVVAGALTKQEEEKFRRVVDQECQQISTKQSAAGYFELRCLCLRGCIDGVIKALTILYRQHVAMQSLTKAGLPVVCKQNADRTMSESASVFCGGRVTGK